jgi:hypothetical protein
MKERISNPAKSARDPVPTFNNTKRYDYAQNFQPGKRL